jgi:tetratricopeptide (TPR) repeat protein
MVKDEDVLNEPAKLSQILTRFKDDPFSLVRRGGPQVLVRACVSQHQARGRYSTAVEILQQGIALDPKDGWSYNQLAWIKATSPDASVRNGSEAVAAANKACELTSWKNPRYIDTLAAAYAEAGDFKRAVEFQERALRTANRTNSERQPMRERLSLYRQSQPFREKLNDSVEH